MTDMTHPEELRRIATQLRLYGLLSEWSSLSLEPWVACFITLEIAERARRSKEYRIRNAKIGNFKSMVDFDWKHPRKSTGRRFSSC